MVKYYLIHDNDNNIFTFKNVEKIKHKLYFKENKVKIILTNKGIFKPINNLFVHYKFIDNDVKIFNNYINNYNLLIDDSKWIKTNEYNVIPPEHKLLEENIITFKLNEKSRTQFIFEEINGIMDNYIQSDDGVDSFSLKEDIITFLSLLKKY